MTRPHRIGFLVFEDAKMLDAAGSSGVFAESNLGGGNYETSMLTTDRNGSGHRSGFGHPRTDG